MYCPRCGHPNPEGAGYCMQCGTPLPPMPPRPQQPPQQHQPPESGTRPGYLSADPAPVCPPPPPAPTVDGVLQSLAGSGWMVAGGVALTLAVLLGAAVDLATGFAPIRLVAGMGEKLLQAANGALNFFELAALAQTLQSSLSWYGVLTMATGLACLAAACLTVAGVWLTAADVRRRRTGARRARGIRMIRLAQGVRAVLIGLDTVGAIVAVEQIRRIFASGTAVTGALFWTQVGWGVGLAAELLWFAVLLQMLGNLRQTLEEGRYPDTLPAFLPVLTAVMVLFEAVWQIATPGTGLLRLPQGVALGVSGLIFGLLLARYRRQMRRTVSGPDPDLDLDQDPAQPQQAEGGPAAGCPPEPGTAGGAPVRPGQPIYLAPDRFPREAQPDLRPPRTVSDTILRLLSSPGMVAGTAAYLLAVVLQLVGIWGKSTAARVAEQGLSSLLGMLSQSGLNGFQILALQQDFSAGLTWFRRWDLAAGLAGLAVGAVVLACLWRLVRQGKRPEGRQSLCRTLTWLRRMMPVQIALLAFQAVGGGLLLSGRVAALGKVLTGFPAGLMTGLVWVTVVLTVAVGSVLLLVNRSMLAGLGQTVAQGRPPKRQPGLAAALLMLAAVCGLLALPQSVLSGNLPGAGALLCTVVARAAFSLTLFAYCRQIARALPDPDLS